MSEETLSRQLVVFSLGGEEYALPITQVHEIIRYAEPRSVASADPSVRGVISLRGKILPVYDLATRLGIDARRRPRARPRSSSSRPPRTWPASSSTTSRRSSRSTPTQLDEAPGADAAASTASPRSMTASSSCSTPRASSAPAADAARRRGRRVRRGPPRRRLGRAGPPSLARARRRPHRQRPGSSSPTTPPSCAACSPRRCATRGFEVVGEAADGDEALALYRDACAPTP